MYTVKTWDGININDGINYICIIPDDAPFMPSVEARFVKRSDNFPHYAGKNFDMVKIPLVLKTLKKDLTASIRRMFDTSNITPKRLVVTYDEIGEDVYIEGVPITVELEGTSKFEIILAVADPIWKSVEIQETTATVSDANPSIQLDITSALEVYPTYTIQPSIGIDGYRFMRFVKIWNKLNERLTSYPLDITNGGLDTASLVTQGKMLANGNDLRVFVDGAEVPRWITDMNTSATKVWIIVDLPAKMETKLGAVIPANGSINEIIIQPTKTNDDILRKMPTAGIVEIDNEIFTYNAIDLVQRKLYGVTRAQKGTTAAVHLAGATVKLIPRDIWLVYGNQLADEPEQDNTYKPLFNLTTSSNTQWIYPGDGFWASSGLRTGAWNPAVVVSTGKTSRYYTAGEGADIDPAMRMGCEMNIWERNGNVMGESARIVWVLSNPCMITRISASGTKYRNYVAFPTFAGLQKMLDAGMSWMNVWNETFPSQQNTWISWSKTNYAVDAKYVRFALEGSIFANALNRANFEVSTVIIDINATNTPVINVFPEYGQRHINVTITNTTLNERIQLKTPSITGDTIIIDTEHKIVTMNGQNSINSLQVSEIRRDWLRLVPGMNELTFTSNEGSLGVLDVTVSYRTRW